jgi:hypothetical protein
VIVNQAAIISSSQPFFSYLIEFNGPLRLPLYLAPPNENLTKSRAAVTEDGGDDGRAKRYVAKRRGTEKLALFAA